ncbi:MAG TPA: endonuclease/exonuclease/phosphatase family protein [Bacteriovoracaceae bacterium]|nr:endonuclease/exonuclease/phosphatase family protein [Bacteriovoracaceae bacterium]
MKWKLTLAFFSFLVMNMVHSFTIGSQNLYHYNTRLPERLLHLRQEVGNGDIPQIIGFQEAARWRGKMSLYDSFIGLTGYQGIYQNTNEYLLMNEGMALASNLPSKKVWSVELPETEMFSRQFINAGIYYVDGNKEILVINVHLSPFEKNQWRRIAQVKFLLEIIQRYNELPVVVIGDLNDQYGSEVLGLLRASGLVDVLDGQEATYDPDSNPLVTDQRFGPSRLDYILIQPEKLEVVKAELMFKENWVSDHYGLKAKLKFISE